MELSLEFALIVLLLIGQGITLVLLFSKRGEAKASPELLTRLQNLESLLQNAEQAQRAGFREQREELSSHIRDFRSELHGSVREMRDDLVKQSETQSGHLRSSLDQTLESLKKLIEVSMNSLNQTQKDRFGVLETRQGELIQSTENRLNQIRESVEEKLQKTLSERLGQSFETVGKQLLEVQRGLGEMQNLAQDVGGLKKVLSNVKMRGGIGEVQLEMLLEQILAPDQYEANVKTKEGSSDLVEFAVKLPGKGDGTKPVWLPVDAKFPKDVYEALLDAHESGDLTRIELAQKNLETTVKSMAKDISTKYVDPPNTTEFAILFLPFEGIFAEVVRKASLLEELHRQYKVIVTGPTTLAAILNSLQMGFKTLAIEKRSGEVWKVLGAVKKEFENFGGLLGKAQNNIQTGLGQLDEILGRRTRAIQRSLQKVETLSGPEAQAYLPTDDSV